MADTVTVDQLVAAYKVLFETNTHIKTTEVRDPATDEITDIVEASAPNVMSTEVEDMIRPLFGAFLNMLLEHGVALGKSTATELDVG